MTDVVNWLTEPRWTMSPASILITYIAVNLGWKGLQR